MLRTRVFWMLLAWVVVQHASVAHAGPVEQLRQLLLRPGHPETRLLRYENGGDGLFYSNDSGKTFDLACVSAIDPTLLQSGSVILTGDGTTLMGVFKGLWQDDGKGCGWSKVSELEGLWVTDFALHPTDSAITFAITSTAGKANGIWRRDADGAWSAVGKRDDGLLINTLDVVTVDDKLRFYEGTLKTLDTAGDAGATSQYVLRYSDDEAETWHEYPFASEGAGQLRIVAIDPSAPDRMVVVIDREAEDDSVLVSSDKGETFHEFTTLSQYGGIAFAPDGRVWLGESGSTTNSGASTGLWAAASLDDEPKKLADYVVQCLTYDTSSDALLACQHWFLGAVDEKSGEFTASFKLVEAKDFLSCDGGDMPAMCKAQLCMAYCGAGHFAQAPLCSAYDEPACGPTADGPLPGAGGTGGSGASAGTGGAGAGSGGSKANAGDSGSSASGSGGATGSKDDDPKDDDGGCAIAGAGNAGVGSTWPMAPSSIAGIALALLCVRRRASRVRRAAS